MENLTKDQSDIIARQLMKEIQYDNGWVDRYNPESYHKKWVDKISPLAQAFFSANPNVLTNDDIENICCGELGENKELYGNLVGYKELDDVLNEYFDNE